MVKNNQNAYDSAQKVIGMVQSKGFVLIGPMHSQTATKNNVFLLAKQDGKNLKKYVLKIENISKVNLAKLYPNKGFARDLAVSKYLSGQTSNAKSIRAFTPRIAMSSNPANAQLFFIQEYMKGRKAKPLADINMLAEMFASLHKVKPPKNFGKLYLKKDMFAKFALKKTDLKVHTKADGKVQKKAYGKAQKRAAGRDYGFALEVVSCLEDACIAFNKDYQRIFGSRRVICHNDAVFQNIICGKDRAYLIDFEWAGMAHPVFDIASFLSPLSAKWAGMEFSNKFERKFIEAYSKKMDFNAEEFKSGLFAAKHFIFCAQLKWAIGILCANYGAKKPGRHTKRAKYEYEYANEITSEKFLRKSLSWLIEN